VAVHLSQKQYEKAIREYNTQSTYEKLKDMPGMFKIIKAYMVLKQYERNE
jgi:hypothetical protein